MKFGAAIDLPLLDDETAKAAYLALCDSITPEIEMKWDHLCPTPDAYDFSGADRIAEFASSNGLGLRGHTLLWDKAVPTWAMERMRTEREWHLVRDHMLSVIGRYRSLVRRWDVVNEPLQGDGLKPSVFLECFGPAYIDWAFLAARQAAPEGLLLLNEYGMEYASDEEGSKRLGLLKLVERMRSRAMPLDGVGLQAHLDLSKGPLDVNGIYGLIRDLEGLGMEVEITELDVLEADTGLPLETRDALVADEIRRYLDVVLQFDCVTRVSTWGLCDAHSWLPEGNRGLPLDAGWYPKRFKGALESCLEQHRSR